MTLPSIMMRVLLSCLAALLVALFMPAHAGVLEQEDDIILYRAVTGDNLYTLAQQHLLRIEDYRIVQALNQIEDPYRLPVGTTLRIPRRLLRFTPLAARILAFRGPVSLLRNNRQIPIQRGTNALEGDEISTGANGFVSFGLPDHSNISLPSQSRIAIVRLRRLSLTNGLVRDFKLLGGRSRTMVTPIDPARDEYRFSTPSAVSAVRGTEFRMSYIDGRSSTEVLHGRVDVSTLTGNDRQQVDAGYGAIIDDGGGSPPFALLAPPALVNPGRVQASAMLGFTIPPVAGARTFHVQVARDAGFIDIASETQAAGPELALSSVPAGTWFVRIAALDEKGLEGLPATFGFRRIEPVERAASAGRRNDVPRYLFRWAGGEGKRSRYRFQLVSTSPDALPVVDEIDLSSAEYVVTNLSAGDYYWRVITTEPAEIRPQRLVMPWEKFTIGEPE